ncbi:PhzF family phenazine biosynthesis protein [Shewanella baltica]|uniref:PhzF family phenazine biosynthesis protein n=1 Tax=Shewanella baltica TaxID=62322 RepID=UPI003D7C022A
MSSVFNSTITVISVSKDRFHTNANSLLWDCKTKWLKGYKDIQSYIYDVFCDESAVGNPCGVVILDEWLTDSELLALTNELAQPVTSFVVENAQGYWIRWFSLSCEINLCGHGSLGAGAAIAEHFGRQLVILQSQYGNVVISKQNEFYQIALPSWDAKLSELDITPFGLNHSVKDQFTTRDLVIVLDSEEAVRHFEPDFGRLMQIEDYHAFIVTAQSGPTEYVLRYFAPKIGIPEDLATGSAQCSLAPYWFDKLKSDSLSVRQLSSSGGYFQVDKCATDSILVSAYVKQRIGAVICSENFAVL